MRFELLIHQRELLLAITFQSYTLRVILMWKVAKLPIGNSGALYEATCLGFIIQSAEWFILRRNEKLLGTFP